MELKDVIHFYIGCEVQKNYGVNAPTIHKLTGIRQSPANNDLLMFLDGKDQIRSHLWNDFKPILRPLSDMSEEELLMADKICNEDDNASPMMAKLPFYLLSKHFDLFNLISTGQAISKTLNS